MPGTASSTASASASASTATTCAPRCAKKRAWRPWPAATSSTRAPDGTRAAKRSIHAEGDSVTWVLVESISFVGRFLGEPSEESCDVGALGGAGGREREIAARGIVFLREWRDQSP